MAIGMLLDNGNIGALGFGCILNPVEYVARLDGTDQFWQLSEPIVYGDNDFAVEIEFSTTVSGDVQNYIIDYDFDLYLKITVYTGGKLLVLIGNGGASWRVQLDGNIVVNDGENHKIKLLREGSRYSLYVDGAEDASKDIDRVLDVRFSNIGRRANGTQFFSDYVKNLSFYSGGTLTNSIPLTNKAQGATQLPTVGNVSATMIGYSEDVWEEV